MIEQLEKLLLLCEEMIETSVLHEEQAWRDHADAVGAAIVYVNTSEQLFKHQKSINDTHWKVSDLINTIKQETRPIEGHTDPGAIEDCWKELMELLEISLRFSRKDFLK